MKKVRYIAFDGCDGLGKTTQLNLLAKRLKEQGKGVYSTKLLGGDGTCDFQLAMRKVLLHSKFPKNSVELEEQMFALTDLEGINLAKKQLSETKDIVLKDRAVMSHVAYALAKGMPLSKIEECHRDVIIAEKEVNRKYGALHIIMVPDDVRWLVRRIAARNAQDGTEIVERLENVETQQRVADAMRQSSFYSFSRDIAFEQILVSESDSIEVVRQKVDAVLQRYEVSAEPREI